MVDQPEKRDRSKRSETQSTMAVSREIAARVRELATANNATTYDVMNGLLDFALKHANIKIQVREVAIVPVEPKGKRSAKK